MKKKVIRQGIALIRSWAVLELLREASMLLVKTGDEAMGWPRSGVALFLLPTLAVWAAIGVRAVLPSWPMRVLSFWVATVIGGLMFLTSLQYRAIGHPAERAMMLFWVGLAGVAAMLLFLKARAWPSWRGFGEMTSAALIVALVLAGFAWDDDRTTRAIIAQAEARWTEIGLPMGEFDQTLAAARENTGSLFLRHALRAQVNSHFYKDGTRLAQREPAIERSEAAEEGLAQSVKLLDVKLPQSDDLALAPESIATIESQAAEFDADYRCILAAESPGWYSDAHDGYELDVPNFLGIRKFAQIAAATALQRFSCGDQEGAERALAAGLHLREGLLKNADTVSLMIALGVDALLSSRQVWLTTPDDRSITQDAIRLRAELLRRLQIESWVNLRNAKVIVADGNKAFFDGRIFRDGLLKTVLKEENGGGRLPLPRSTMRNTRRSKNHPPR